MYVIMDMGTTNTRLYMCVNSKVVDHVKGSFGASLGKTKGRGELCKQVECLLKELLKKCAVNECDIEIIVASGMPGSEIGLFEVPHIFLPTDARSLVVNIQKVKIDGINIPFLFIPGVKKAEGDVLMDMMRGEETETIGLASMISPDEEVIFVLPGTHNKIVRVGGDGNIIDFYTTFSGELLDSIISNTILAGQVTHDFQVVESEVLNGALYAKENGLNAALFHIRVMAKNGIGVNALSSFLYGCVIGEDVCLIKRIAQGKRIYISGKRTFREVYSMLLGEENTVLLDDDTCSRMMFSGAILVKRIYDACNRRKSVMEKIERERVIAIVRDAEKENFVESIQALYEGGIRLAEITFDRSRKKSTQGTAALIKMLVEKFGDDMCIGAGTVTCTEEVFAAFEAGASYIISPNCDPDIISLTRKLGLVSMPAAYTATEIATAIKYGADYVKLFPADQVSEEYVKAIRAPLSDAKLFAVGGVNADNAGEFFEMGFCGIGVGSNLYDKKLIKEKNFDALRALASQYSCLSKIED